MPLKAEKLSLPRTLDRRIKITEPQKAEVKKLSEDGMSQRKIAKEVGISRPMVGFILEPKKWEENLKKRATRKDSIKQYYKNKDKQAKWQREYRKYKQELHLKDKLINDKNLKIQHKVKFHFTSIKNKLSGTCEKSKYCGEYDKSILDSEVTNYQFHKLRRALSKSTSVILQLSENVLEKSIIRKK